MKESIVKVPRDNTADYDFIAFSFDGKHSYEDFNIYRVSAGNKYREDLAPTLKDTTAEIPGSDGMQLLSVYHAQRVFNINIAFDKITDGKIREIKNWLNGRKVCDLWFAEAPYKVYSAKVTGQPQITFIPFDEDGQRVYKGEGTIQFTCYQPYAHTPTYVLDSNGQYLEGNYYTSYSDFNNYKELYNAGVLPGQINNEYGDLPFNFVAKLDNIEEDRKILMKVSVTGTEYDITGKDISINVDDKTIVI